MCLHPFTILGTLPVASSLSVMNSSSYIICDGVVEIGMNAFLYSSLTI